MCEIYVWEGRYPEREYKPACERAEALARIAGVEMLTEETLALARELGLKVRWKSPWRPSEALLEYMAKA